MNRTTERPVIGKYLDISSGHISETDSEILDVTACANPLTVYKYKEGWFVHVSSENKYFLATLKAAREFGYSDEFQNILRRAYAKGCWFVRLDADGTTYADLPTFNW